MSDNPSLTGQITGEAVEVRFAFSGRILSVHKQPGDQVKTGELLADLDRQSLQTELDRELADYERVRAEFEIFVKKQGDPQSDIDKYTRTQVQSLLTVSVKAVELAKFRLDQATLTSPVNGVVLDTGGLRPRLFVTPGANPIRILDRDSLAFSVSVGWADLAGFPDNGRYRVELETFSDSLPAVILPFIPPIGTQKTPLLRFRLDSELQIFPGLTGRLLRE